MDPLFELPPEELAEIEDQELAAQADTLRARVREIVDGRRDPNIVGERTQTQVTEEVEQAVLAIERIESELEARTRQDDQYDETIDSLAQRAGVEELATEEPEPEEEKGEEEEGDEKEAKTAAVQEKVQLSSLPAARRHRPLEPVAEISGLRVTQYAAGLGSPYEPTALLDRQALGRFLTEIIRRKRVPAQGHKAVLAHASFSFPRERILEDGPDGYHINSERIRDVVGTQALVASGGRCAPLPPIYTLPGVETPARPVRDSLASFQAARGGVQVGATPKMGDYSGAVGIVLESENELGGTHALKTCMHVECPEFSPVVVDAIYSCIEADNLSAMAYPELMSRIADLVLAEQARLAESKLLQEIKDGSTDTIYGSTDPGASFQALGAIYQAAAGIRSRNRMTAGTVLDALMPAWLIDLIALDQGRAGNQDARPQTRAAVEAYLGQVGVRPTYYLDGPEDGTGQIFGAQSSGGAALLDFPADAQIAIFPTGTWLHLDAGELQLGVVRDSTLNATNDHQIFAESWENVAYVGVESVWITLTMCPSGAFALDSDVSSFC